MLEKQGLALQDHCENIRDASNNPSKCLTILKEKAHYIFKKHIENHTLKNLAYLSPRLPNKTIEVMWKCIIQHDIIKEVKVSGFYSTFDNEVTASNKEILCICIRYVKKNVDIQEFSFLMLCHKIELLAKVLAILEQTLSDVQKNTAIVLLTCNQTKMYQRLTY